MSWFHKDHGGKVHPILKHADYTAILGAEAKDGRLVRLCYTGHAGVTEHGVVQAIEFTDRGDGKTLWRQNLASESDLSDGHVVVTKDVVVTRIAEKGGHTVIGHGLWAGEEKWRHHVAQMVSRMGIDGGSHVLFVTIDHAVHVIDIVSGTQKPHDPVATDQARDRVVGKTRAPRFDYQTGDTSPAPEEWSDARNVLGELKVYERDWAGTREIGVGVLPNVTVLGKGRYNGALRVGNVVVLSFSLEHHHWYIYSADAGELLAVMREDGKSELFAHGHSIWQGKL